MKKFLVSSFFAIAGMISIPAMACTTAIISAEASGTGRPLLWKHRDTDEYYNHIEYLKGEKYSFTALVNSKDEVYEEVWAGANEKGFVIANNVSYSINLRRCNDESPRCLCYCGRIRGIHQDYGDT